MSLFAINYKCSGFSRPTLHVNKNNVQVCGFRAGPQDNWLITQLINRTVNGIRLPQVSVMIEFELRDCDVTLNCLRSFNTHIYETSAENSAAARSIINYR